jgi:hypothetical protein
LSAVDLVADEERFQLNVLMGMFSEKDWLFGKGADQCHRNIRLDGETVRCQIRAQAA